MVMEDRYELGQDELGYMYESAQSRMAAHPDFAKRYKKMIADCTHFDNEQDALQAAIKPAREGEFDYYCQIWAKIEKDEEFYRISDYWIVTGDVQIQQAAEYIGMALVYDNARLQRISQEKA